MAESKCENCRMREKYDVKPKSLPGRFWRWHINFCPGWKGYMKTLNEDQTKAVVAAYNL